MLPEYKYQCKDQSLLLPHFKKWVVEPCMKFVPWGVPANIITIVSNFFLYAALILAFQHTPGSLLSYLLVPLLIFLYVLGDHIDGAQAKRTGTGSQLGEFHDHYLDAFNNGIIIVISLLLLQIQNPYLIALVFFSSYLAHTALIYEQFRTKWLIFEKMSALEGDFMILLLILAQSIPSVQVFFTSSLIFSLTPAEFVLCFTILGALGTFLKSVKRTKNFTIPFVLYLIIQIFMGVYAFFFLSIPQTFLLFTLFNGVYMGKLMRGYLTDAVERNPDFLTPLALIVLAWIQLVTLKPLIYHGLIYIFLYLGLMVVYIIIRTFYPLRHFWVWKNPPK